MADPENGLSQWRERFSNWLNAPGQTNRNAVITGLISGVILLAVPVLVGVVLSALDLINLNGNLPAGLIFGVGGATLAGGIVLGIRGNQLVSRPKLEATQTRLELEQQKRKNLEPDAEALTRLNVYIEHYLLVLQDVIERKHGLGEFPAKIDPALSKPLCETPSEILKKAAEIEAICSIWVEASPLLGRDRYSILGPQHRDEELRDFAVRVKDSWLEFSQRNRPPDADRIHKLDDLNQATLPGADLDAFRKWGYQSGRVLPIPCGDGRFAFVVILSKTSVAFSSLEDQWLLLLSAALSLAAQRTVAAA